MSTLKNKHNSEYDLYGDVAKIKSALYEAGQDVKGRAAEMFIDSYESVKERTNAAKKGIENYTVKKPFKSLGIAMAIGFAVGYFFRK
ncbi:MAG: hypothetical protein ACD_46C00085G0007 [uncultured bacterium]|nr:MAG: hypothetical protein ACD_46C00085G0007 [uncultured bacterium]